MSKQPETVLAIPGQWADRSELVMSIASQSDGYLFAGPLLFHVDTKTGWTLDVVEHDPEVLKSFALAGRGRLSAEELAQINQHTFMLYLVGPGGSVESASGLLHAAQALLKSGGLAVKVESAGTAHSKARWAELCSEASLGDLLRAYVTYVGGGGEYYSCGMHNLGFPDAVVEAEIPPQEAAELIDTFLGFLLSENPTLNDGETFSIAADAPRYRLVHESNTRFESDDLFFNPFGVWKLISV
ncbi:MAG: DUF4261 domain-containing protein [Planctomycetes bacterium]|nr:DUF4261 domain-containing protein [Planctomycetota bacterium]